MTRYLLFVSLILAALILGRLVVNQAPLLPESSTEVVRETGVVSPRLEKPATVPPSPAPAPQPPERKVFSPTAYEPSGPEQISLEESINQENENKRQREAYLLKTLGLDRIQLEKLDELRASTEATESKLIAKPSGSPEEEAQIQKELIAIRKTYEDKMAKELGPERWKAYNEYFYSTHGLAASDEVASLALPLK